MSNTSEKLCEWGSRSLWRQECKDEESIQRHGKWFYFVKDKHNLILWSEQWGPSVDCSGDLYHGVLSYLLLERYFTNRDMIKEQMKEGNESGLDNASKIISDMDAFIDVIMMREVEESRKK